MMRPAQKPSREPLPIATASADSNSRALEFWTEHPQKAAKISLIEFETGNSKNHPQWGGDFNGRPALIHELAPHIKVIYRTSPEQTCINLINTLRFWWRLFDEYEEISPVERVSDINQIHEAAQLRKNAAVGRTNAFLVLVNARRMELGLGRLFWIKRENSTIQKELISHDQIKLVYQELKRRSWTALDKIKASRNLIGVSRHKELGNRAGTDDWSFADKVATYKHFSIKVQHPCPPQRQMRGFSYKLGEWSPTIIESLYYSLDELRAFFFLTLLLTGWNAETTLDIDLDREPIIPHPTSTGFMILRSVKTRGNTEQVAICQAKRELSPTSLVAEVVRATEPLREHLRLLLRELPADADRKQRSELERCIRSVWLYPVPGGVIRRLTNSDATRPSPQGEEGVRLDYLPMLAHSINSKIEEPKNRLPLLLNARNLRDAFISFAYANNGYNWLIAKLAAGHVDVNTTRTYLNKTHWARFGRNKIRQLTDALWRDIGERRIVEPAFLYAMVQRGEITEKQRTRWLAHHDRTRIGVGCKDFTHPPKSLVPDHRDGMGCRAFRCTLCPNAVIFPDSLDHLARRAAELDWASETIPLVSWEQSIFPDEVLSLEAALALYPKEDADARISLWKRKIASGDHLPTLQEGEYE